LTFLIPQVGRINKELYCIVLCTDHSVPQKGAAGGEEEKKDNYSSTQGEEGNAKTLAEVR